jgi:integrase/recombinase XerD
MKNITVERVILDGGNRIALKFPYDQELNGVVKELLDAQWNSDMKYWHIPDSSDIVSILLRTFHGKASIDYSALKLNLAETIRIKKEEKKINTSGSVKISSSAEFSTLSEKGDADIARYKRWMEANRYPKTTVQTYVSMMIKFLKFVCPREAEECTGDDLIRFIDEYILPKGLSQSFQNQMISSVKKFYTHIYKMAIDPVKIQRPRPRHKLPNVLGKDEIKKMLRSLSNEKHRVMLSLIYACGLRRSELINLVPVDIERNRNLLRIRQAKGFKDRVVPVSVKTIEMVDAYMDHFKPQKYLFEGQLPGEPYSVSSLEKVLKNACTRAGIRKPVTLHWLRHSYATHLLESGTDLRYIQELLGHQSSKTTEIYTHVTTKGIQNIRSPFDDL